jgi:sodium/bile acid cotransporter 7
MLKKIGLDGFILALAFAVIIARIYPAAGLDYESFSLSKITNIGVAFIFFFYGLKLNFEEIKKGLKNWKLHVLIHLTTFVLFPVIILLLKYFFAGTDYYLLWLGVFFLAALPSTVSSSVVMVNIAHGNVPSAIFNASISSFLGIFFTPLWMNIEMQAGSSDFDMQGTLFKLILQVLVPVIAGVVLNRFWGKWASKNKNTLKYFDQSIIVLIVYASFAKSFDQNIFSQQSVWVIIALFASMLCLFGLVFFIVRYICKLLRFNQADTVTAIFCGSKKSLVHGSVMAAVLFGESTMAGLMLLPIMIYHALQLILASWIANYWGAKYSKESAQLPVS